MKILIVEDEIMVARALKRMITSALKEHPLELTHSQSLHDAKSFLSANAIDVLFLDLNLNGEDGMSLLADLVSAPFQTIIVSANTDQALRAFEYGVIDFVAKPFDEARLSKAINRLIPSDATSQSGQGNAEFLGIKRGGTTQLITAPDIINIQAADNYSEIHLINGDSFLHEKNLKRLLEILPPTFQRVHRSTIVNMNHVARLEAYEGSRYEIQLKSGVIISVGRAYVSKLRQRLS